MQQESIYNLLPIAKIIPPKDKLYSSLHPYYLAPTATTFLLQGTSFPNVANMGGESVLPRGAHPLRSSMSTIGKPIGSYRIDPIHFIKRNHTYKILPPCQPLRSQSEIRKPAVPSIKDKPIMGLKSDKNYIIANALDAMLMATRKKPIEEVDFRNKKGYGKVPKYLKRLRRMIENEHNLSHELEDKEKEEQDRNKKVIPENELNALREALRKKLEIVRFEYGKISHKRKFDSVRSIKRKEDMEKELGILEDDLSKLNNKSVIVDMTK